MLYNILIVFMCSRKFESCTIIHIRCFGIVESFGDGVIRWNSQCRYTFSITLSLHECTISDDGSVFFLHLNGQWDGDKNEAGDGD